MTPAAALDADEVEALDVGLAGVPVGVSRPVAGGFLTTAAMVVAVCRFLLER